MIEYHREMINAREKEEKRKADLDMVIEDVRFLVRPVVETTLNRMTSGR